MYGSEEAFANSEIERYLRVLQQQGAVPLHPWSIRAFTPVELSRIWPGQDDHPWARRIAHTGQGESLGVEWINPRARLAHNTGFPHGSNDGAVWMGRGVTTIAEAGVRAQLGPLSLTLAPLVFRAENRGFELGEMGGEGPTSYRDLRNPSRIDLPQRFGGGAYARLDPGQSSLRLDVAGVTAGVSTANEAWGPAIENPMLLGTNAGGFTHVFLGTDRPIDISIGKLHGRLLGGWLMQSDYASMPADSSTRFASGMVAVITPRGADGLELGVTRFFHFNASRDLGDLRNLSAPVGGLFGESTDNAAENQLATAFVRWLFRPAAAELYAEYLWEDYSWDFRGLMLNPDLNAGYMVGFAKSWAGRGARMTQLRAEVVNARTDPASPAGFTTPIYSHTRMRQGHTHRGQLLGSPAGYGGTLTLVAVDRFHPNGRWTVEWTRRLVGEGRPRGSDGEDVVDALHSLTADVLLLRGAFSVEAALGGVYEFDRNFRGDDFNLHTSLGVSWNP